MGNMTGLVTEESNVAVHTILMLCFFKTSSTRNQWAKSLTCKIVQINKIIISFSRNEWSLFESSSSKDTLLEIGPVVLEKKFSEICLQCIFAISLSFPIGKGHSWAFVWTNLKHLHSRMLFAMFGWTRASDSRNVFFCYFIIFPCKRAWPFI